MEDMMDLAGYLTKTQQYLNSIKDPLSESLTDLLSLVNMHVTQSTTSAVTYPTTLAQYFHLLRRQIKRNFSKRLLRLSVHFTFTYV